MKRFFKSNLTVHVRKPQWVAAQSNVMQNRCLCNSIARPSLHLDLECKEIIYQGLVNQQQRRGYAPTLSSTLVKECWNCKKSLDMSTEAMMCGNCHHLQDVDKDINYFNLMNIAQDFSLDAQSLTKRFRQMQSIVHPDKFSNKSSREQNNSADWSSLINKAYKTLLIPIERGQYLLNLSGLQLPQDNSALNKEFLMEMMERNEQVEDATNIEDLKKLSKRLKDDLEKKVLELSRAFNDSNFEVAQLLLIEMKYLISIENSVKNKSQTLMNGISS
ncbi:iron-sulfur cluster co-chaperone protein HscB-like protein, mitochondrial [Glossina fuscipes fuscipes]